jgi:hypothetical protein
MSIKINVVKNALLNRELYPIQFIWIKVQSTVTNKLLMFMRM